MSSYSKVVTSAQDSVLSGVTDVFNAQTDAVNSVREASAGVLRSVADLPVVPSLIENTFGIAKDLQDLQKQSLLLWANFIDPGKPASRSAKAA